MDHLKYCKLCLATDIKIYNMNKSIIEVYSKLLQLPILEHQHYICYECAALLRKYQEFHSKCKQAHSLLTAIQSDNTQITSQVVKEINRKKYNLESKLIMTPIKTYNNQFKMPKDCSDIIIEEKIIVDEIKSEVDGLDNCENVDSKLQKNNFVLKENIIIMTINPYESNQNPDYERHGNSDINLTTQTKIERHKIEAECTTITRKKKERSTDLGNYVQNDIIDVTSFSDLDDEPLAKRFKTAKKKQKTANIHKESKETGKRKSGPKFDASYFEDYATVVMLTPEDAKKEILLRKQSSNYINCPFKCEFCYKGYESKSTFENHMKRHNLEYGKFECDICQMRFPEQYTLTKHLFNCHKRKFYCKICTYTCFSTTQARTHMSLHKGKKYPCSECDEIFSMPNSLLMHKRVKHSAQCVCALCGSTFTTQRGLYWHKMATHRQETNDEKGPKCEDCGVHFATETAWKRHLVLSSKHEVSNGCKFCGETFLDEEALKRHTRVMHSRNQRYRANPCTDNVNLPAACTICDKWLDKRAEYNSHMTSQHPLSEAAKRIDAREQVQSVCEVCGEAFKKQCFLLYHQRKHTGERPYECRECGKTYASPPALSMHKRTHTHKTTHKHKSTHTTKRVYQCDKCHKVFTEGSTLRKHIKAHLGIRPYKCSVCEKAFPHPCDVKNHIKHVHEKVPWPKRDRSKRSAAESADL